MPSSNDVAAQDGEVLYQSRLSLKFVLLLLGGALYISVITFVCSLVAGETMASQLKMSSVVFPQLMLLWAGRSLRLRVTLTRKRLIHESGLIWHKVVEMSLQDIDTARLREAGVSKPVEILTTKGVRFPLWPSINRVEVCRKILEITGKDAGYEPDLLALRFSSLYAVTQLVGAPLFFPISFFVFGQFWETADPTQQTIGFVLAFLLIPSLGFAGCFLGGILAVGFFPGWRNAEEAARSVVYCLRSMYYVTSAKNKKSWNARLYEKILTWRYGQAVKLPF